MQSFTDIPESHTLRQSLTELMNNDKTNRSLSAGSSFPTTDLFVGMPCYREDQQKLYQLKSVGPDVWVMIADLSKTPAFKESPTFTGPVSIEDGDATIQQTSDNSLVTYGTNKSVQSAGVGSYMTANAAFDGTNWNRINTANPAFAIALTQNGTEFLFAAAGANPITWAANKLWNANNDGAGSGLDADTVDGKHASDMLLKAGGDMTGAIGFASASVAAAATTDIGGAAGNSIDVTGTANITSFGTATKGTIKVVKFAAGGSTVANNANIICPGGRLLDVLAGDTMTLRSEGGTVWTVCMHVSSAGISASVRWRVEYVTSASKTMTVTDNMKLVVFKGTGNNTFALPALSTVGDGYVCSVRNSKTSGTLTVDPNGSELVDQSATLSIGSNAQRTFISTADGWMGLETGNGTPLAADSGFNNGFTLFSTPGISTFTPGAGVTQVRATVLGGGAGGGSGGLAVVNYSNATSQRYGASGGSGGGAGGTARGVVSVSPGTPVTVTVGAGGVGADAASAAATNSSNAFVVNGKDGNNGGTSSFGGYLSALGGFAGKGGVAAAVSYNSTLNVSGASAGTGGTATGGTIINQTGGTGGASGSIYHYYNSGGVEVILLTGGGSGGTPWALSRATPPTASASTAINLSNNGSSNYLFVAPGADGTAGSLAATYGGLGGNNGLGVVSQTYTTSYTPSAPTAGVTADYPESSGTNGANAPAHVYTSTTTAVSAPSTVQQKGFGSGGNGGAAFSARTTASVSTFNVTGTTGAAGVSGCVLVEW